MKRFLLQHLFIDPVKNFPHKPAVSCGDKAIDYQTLDNKSNQLAHLIRKTGFQSGDLAAVLLNKSVETVIAMQGILKAGGAYVPLDLHYSPVKRILHILQASEVLFLLTDRKGFLQIAAEINNANYAFKNAINVIFIDNLLTNDADQNESNLLEITDSESFSFFCYGPSLRNDSVGETDIIDTDLAYILYTSGSTGEPKGVMISLRNALTFINWALNYFKPRNSDHFSGIAPLHFDLSVFDIYVCLASGATLHLLPPIIRANPRAILEWIKEKQISIFYSVPSLWISILNYTDISQGSLLHLRQILFAGETFPPKHLKKLMQLINRASYYNLYGPTETNVCTCFPVKSYDEVKDKPVPIGRACANSRVLALSDKDKPAKIGEEGELLVSGSIVTSGYYKDREKSLAAFRKYEIKAGQNEYFYKTGDIVRRIDEDNYEYVSRKDLMIKCAGFRIEIGEVEQALYQYPAIEEAVVVPRQSLDSNVTELAGFVTFKNGQDFSVIRIKEFLAEVLPRYMIPQIIRKVENLPRTANGKIDRKKISHIIRNENTQEKGSENQE